jgi:hypothetical protein
MRILSLLKIRLVNLEKNIFRGLYSLDKYMNDSIATKDCQDRLSEFS